MVQRELKHKTKLYAVTAVITALLLVGTIYTVTSPTLMYTVTGISPMKNFASTEELKNYLNTNTQAGQTYYTGGPLDAARTTSGLEGNFGDKNLAIAPQNPSSTGNDYYVSSGSSEHSTTNVQVSGVDEADTVKTDGKYIFTLNENYTNTPANTIEIVDAQNPHVVGQIVLNGSTSCAGFYLSENSNKLAVLGSKYGDMVYLPRPVDGTIGLTYDYYANTVKTFIYIYDITDKADPVLTRNLTLTGSYFNSRMIGNYVYTVISQPAYMNNESVILPQVYTSASGKEIAATSIYYTEMQDTYFSYTTFSGVNLMDDSQTPTDMTILMGGTSNMYVSTGNMYVTFPDTTGESTEIYRVTINGANLSFDAKGIVPGYILNQYSMDEYNNYFRVATTVSTGSWVNRDQHNNLYVLNMNLDTVGKIENLAQGERIYSARFTGDKAYLVTFKQTDPFFVLDLKDPTAPTVAGELKIPGYSSYLHPYDENHIIGIGKENNTVKLSLFDVSDMKNPTEVAKYVIGENADYSDSIALYEPKAFLFDPQKQLLVIPASVTNYGYIAPSQEPTLQGGSTSSDSGKDGVTTRPSIPAETGYYWQGAYVFKLSAQNGFTLKGELSHQENTTQNWGYYFGGDAITRSLYIGNTLYTVSNGMVQLNSLDNLNLLGQVKF
jgi:inhibitor of cysteine peptidase